jgi:hypothetical protein
MYINSGCAHYVTVKGGMRSIETTIVHEMTHGCLAHLTLPLWLNEGIAVNTEQRRAGRTVGLYTADQMQARHRRFWNPPRIQEFWSGTSFHRADRGNQLSYDLARILVEHFAKDWEAFASFVAAADRADGGDRAAREHLGISLGESIAAVLQRRQPARWEPRLAVISAARESASPSARPGGRAFA